MLAELAIVRCCADSAAIGGDRLDQRPVEREQIDVFERRRLVEDLVGRECCLASWLILEP